MDSYARKVTLDAPDSALRKKTCMKMTKYSDLVSGLGGRFLPLGFDSLGRFGSNCFDGLAFLLKGMDKWRKDFFCKDLSIALARSWSLQTILSVCHVEDGKVVRL